MLKIEKLSEGETTVLRLSGRIQSDHLPELQIQIEDCTGQTIINLEEVTLIDRAAVGFLSLCEASGIELANCPLHIREWICQEGS